MRALFLGLGVVTMGLVPAAARAKEDVLGSRGMGMGEALRAVASS